VYEIQRRDLIGLRMGPDQSLPVHPSQLYAAAAAALGTVLSFVIRGRRRYSGQVALFAIGFYGVVRYVIEDPFRYDATPEVLGPLSLGQITGMVLVAVVIATHASRVAKLDEDPSSVIQWMGGPWTPEAEKPPPPAAKKKSGKKKSSTAAAAKPADPEADTKPDPAPKHAIKPDAETKPD
jgi:phosphatidylglycerol:prolipoprotein diacylglycerol transferase